MRTSTAADVRRQIHTRYVSQPALTTKFESCVAAISRTLENRGCWQKGGLIDLID